VTASARDEGELPASPIRFRDVAAELGLIARHAPGQRSRNLPEDTGSGLAWGDYDGDGDWDLYVVNYPVASKGKAAHRECANRLFRNDGDRFTDVTEAAGVADPSGFGMGATFADYDDDGDADIYVTNHGPNRLFRNQGDGTFAEVAAAAGVADPLWSTGAAWGDFDRDGRLDLYVCNYLSYDRDQLPTTDVAPEPIAGSYSVPFTLNPNSFDPAPNQLYRNRGDGTFEEVSDRYGVNNPRGRSLAATFCDLDGDGWLDLYINNDVSTNKLYRNMIGDVAGRGADREDVARFVDLSTMTGTADPRGSMGLSVGEIGGLSGEPDGLPDLFITHWVAQENAFYQSVLTTGGQLEYRDKTRQFRLGEVSTDTVGWGTALVDLDLDGRVDLAVANGSTLERRDDPLRLKAEPMFLFWNTGKRFQDVAPHAGEALARPHCARGLAAADFDDDGDVDLAVAINRGQLLLLRNETVTAGRFLKIRLNAPPAACFGAKVRVTTGDQQQTQWWGADVSYLGMHAAELVFGLGASAGADRIDVTWADGKRSTSEDVSTGRLQIDHPNLTQDGVRPR
jgi:hypothetical protein